jgi:CRP-like cAMP-binding protein/di/tricarboxylate transporter
MIVSLKQIEMFQGLSNMELAKLLGRLEKTVLTVGAVLFEQGDPGDRMYIINSGRIELFIQKPDGSRQSLVVLGEGDSLGEMSLLTGESRSATAVAATACDFYEIDRQTFDDMIAENGAISSYFIRLLSGRLVSTNDRLHASKETKSQWIRQELSRLPQDLAEAVLHASVLPVIRVGLIASTLGYPKLNDPEQPIDLSAFLQFQDEEWFTVEPSVKETVAELYIATFGYDEKNRWLRQAAEYYAVQGYIAAAVQTYAEYDDWESVLDLVEQGQAVPDSAADEAHTEWVGIMRLLESCPAELLISRYRVLKLFITYSVDHCSETGLARIETALGLHPLLYSPEQIMQLYEWGAELSKRLNRTQQALEYLQLAEAYSGAEPHAEGTDRTYGLAKLKLARRRTQLLTEHAQGLLKLNCAGGWLAVGLALFTAVLFHFLPPWGGLSRHGMDFIGLGIAAVILWIVNLIPDYIVALIMAAAWVLGGMVTSEVALSGFSTPTWLYMVFIMSISAVITKSGILYRLSLHALLRFPPNYRGQLWGIIAGGIILNPLIPSSSAKVSLGVPIAQTLSESMGFPERSRGTAGLGVAAMVFYGFTAPFVLTGSYTNLMAYALVPGGKSVSWIQWFLYALPAFLVFTAVFLTILSVMFKNVADAGKRISRQVLDEQLKLMGPLSREERMTVFTVIGCILLMILQPLHGVDNTWVMLTGFSILVISGVLDRQTLLAGVDWTFLLFLGIAFSFTAAAKELGIIEAMSSFLGQHMGVFISSPTLFLTAVILLCFIVTLVVRDDPAVILLVIALLPLADQAGVHPWVLVFVILLSTDPFFFAYQSPTYLTAYYSTEGKAFTHKQGQQVAFGYALAIMLVAVLCVPYWRWLGLIS